MARTNNLTNFLTDVASAIKEKKGSQANIPASNFDTEILALPSQGTYQEKTITITQNGQTALTPDSGYDAMERVEITVNVPIKQLQTKTVSVTSNGNVSVLPDTGYDGFNEVNLEVNVPSGGEIPVKLFNSVEEMNRDSSAQEGDLAVVYADDSQPYDGTSPVTSFYFPSTVTLSESGTGSAMGWGILNVECNVSSSSADFTFDDGGDISYYITYTSSDGLTYTRTDGGEDVITISETPISLELMEWSDICGNFMRVSSKAFEGFFRYTTYMDNEHFRFIYLDSATFTILDNNRMANLVYSEHKTDVEYSKTQLRNLLSTITDTFDNVILFIDNVGVHALLVPTSADNSFQWLFYQDDSNGCLGIGSYYRTEGFTNVPLYLLDFDNNTVVAETPINTEQLDTYGALYRNGNLLTFPLRYTYSTDILHNSNYAYTRKTSVYNNAYTIGDSIPTEEKAEYKIVPQHN